MNNFKLYFMNFDPGFIYVDDDMLNINNNKWTMTKKRQIDYKTNTNENKNNNKVKCKLLQFNKGD